MKSTSSGSSASSARHGSVFLPFVLSWALLGSCAGPPASGLEEVSERIQTRTGHGLASDESRDRDPLPPGVDLGDGLDSSEAAAIALWRSPEFALALKGLGLARADLVEARSWKDPVFSFLFPLGPKQYEWTLNLPVEALWQRPARIARAEADLERTGEDLVRAGLDLVRDVSVAWAEARAASRARVLSADRTALAREGLRLAEQRVRLGEASPSEGERAGLVAERAEIAARDAEERERSARIQLAWIVGVELDPELLLPPAPDPTEENADGQGSLLEAVALAARPEIRAAELRLESAARGIGVARRDAWRLSLLLDANEKGEDGFEMGPGLALSLPVLGGSQAGRARARASFEEALAARQALAARVRAEVRTASGRHARSLAALREHRERVLARAEALRARAEQRVALGEASPMEALEARQVALDARTDEGTAELEEQRSRAELERALGCRLDAVATWRESSPDTARGAEGADMQPPGGGS